MDKEAKAFLAAILLVLLGAIILTVIDSNRDKEMAGKGYIYYEGWLPKEVFNRG